MKPRIAPAFTRPLPCKGHFPTGTAVSDAFGTTKGARFPPNPLDSLAKKIVVNPLNALAPMRYHVYAMDTTTKTAKPAKQTFGLGCVVGLASLDGERGTVVDLCRPISGSMFRRYGSEWCEVKLWDGRTLSTLESNVWRQADPSRPWGHDGWRSAI